MIDFQRFDPRQRQLCRQILLHASHRGCACSFANLYMWGRQQYALLDGYMAIFSQFGQRSIYPYPIGQGNIRPVLDALIQDAAQRGMVCRFSGLSDQDCMQLEELYPGRFCFYPDRDSCDYVYKTEDLALLKGRKYQKKRNHLNKFRSEHPDTQIVPLTAENMDAAREFVDLWYAERISADPTGDYHLEQKALRRAFLHYDALEMEGIVLQEHGQILALEIGSRLSPNTFDVHFEKAREDIDGAYAAINQAFAAYVAQRYPEVEFLNREDDMGIPGLRQAKLSYHPHHLVVKFWARLWEETDAD